MQKNRQMGYRNPKQDKNKARSTDKLNKDTGPDLPAQNSELTYHPVPHKDAADKSADHPVWRLRFDVLSSDPIVSFGLDVNGDVILGRGKGPAGLVDLNPYGAEELGVSRRHLMLRPGYTGLFVVDLGSTNKSRWNGRPIGANSPYGLTGGDILNLGNLQLRVTVIRQPKGSPVDITQMIGLTEALTRLTRAIVSQLKLDEVLRQALEMAMSLTSAGEASLWLVDEQTGELFLEAERGIEDERIKRLRLPATEDSLAGKVIRSGQPLRASREVEGQQIKIDTDYMVEAVLYVPLKLGDVAIGVLAAVHREPGNEFSGQAEQLLMAIADVAAVAIQNSRLYEATDKELVRRVAELSALNELTREISASLDLDRVHNALMKQLENQPQIEAAGLWLVDQHTRTVIPFAKPREKSDHIIHKEFKLGEGVVGKVALTGQAQVSKGRLTHTEPGDQDADETTLKLAAQSMACVPLLVEGKVMGVLGVFSKPKSGFSEEYLGLMQAFANHVAIAIQNGRLFAQSEQERATFRSTAAMLSQPLMIINERDELVVSNQAADTLWEKIREQQRNVTATETVGLRSLDQLLERLRDSVGSPVEIALGNETYVATIEHAPNVGTIIIMQDVTDLHKLERLRAEFAQALSHDLRGPLSSIMGFAKLLKGHGLSHSETMEFLDEILGASTRMHSMANQLLDFALLSDLTTAAHRECDLKEVVENAISDLRGAALARAITLDFRVNGRPYRIRGDSTRLYRSVLNLVDNAIKYSPDKSMIRVRLTYEKERVTLQVRDSGPGIPEEELPDIFEKYYRAEDTSSNRLGVGLGLAMVRATVVAHGGEVVAQNVKGGGAEFVVTLPSVTSGNMH